VKTLLVIGHSHIGSLRRAWNEDDSHKLGVEIRFLPLRSERLLKAPDERQHISISDPAVINRDILFADLAEQTAGVNLTVLCLNGNEHNICGLWKAFAVHSGISLDEVFKRAERKHAEWLDLLLPKCPSPVVLLLPPPPIESEGEIRSRLAAERQQLIAQQIPSAEYRLGLWKKQCRFIEALAQSYGLSVAALPTSVFSETGCLAADCYGHDETHGNAEYGRRVLQMLIREVESPRKAPVAGHAKAHAARHPYEGLAPYAYWKRAVSEVPQGELDPVTEVAFKIGPRDKVATAGSCFAQHISKRLRGAGFNFFATESEPERAGASDAEVYDFSARYGNIYTARQLLQLFDRAFGFFRPAERAWARDGGGFCDPFRPRIEPDGFSSEEEVDKARRGHFAAVRRMFKNLDVFVFTLGLTECWASRLDGAVYPVAPGVVGGVFDPQKYEFLNFGVSDVTQDLRAFLHKLRLINPASRVVLTVSPVPLVATAANRHVVVATTYSKSVLRVAAEEAAASQKNVSYFPSYEIITSPHARGAYFGEDGRSVTQNGVDHVMRVFMSRMTDGLADTAERRSKVSESASAKAYAELEALAEANCDEELLAP
jgi:hypothetical protein